MNIQEFNDFHNLKSKDLAVFNSEEATEFSCSDKKVTKEEVKIVENSIGCHLPENYTNFCISHGGGYFGYILILSLDKDGEWFIGNVIKDFSHFIPTGFMPFADDQAGGFYCFKIKDEIAIEDIYYIDSSGLIEKTQFKDFFDFVIKYAYTS